MNRKVVLWSLWALNALIILAFWAVNSGVQMIDGTLPWQLATGRLCGLLATFAALMQLVLMGREGWLEPVFGLDRITYFHQLNGYAALLLMLAHAALIAAAYSSFAGVDLLTFLVLSRDIPYVLFAQVALLLFVVVVGLTIYIVRKHLKFETWYGVHLLVYAAIALVPFHQFVNGGDLVANQLFQAYWIALYAFTLANVLIWRFGRPLYLFYKHRFVVEKVVPEVPRSTSVYMRGRRLEDFRAKGGQFVLVRFLRKGMWWQEHPFSLSQLPNSQYIRLTIRQLGDFTNDIPNLEPGTKVIISGPHGAFTHQRAVKDKTLYIAGGVGITPIRAMIEERAQTGLQHDAVLLFGNRNRQEIIFRQELDELGVALNMPIHHVLSDDVSFAGEHGFVDQEKIARLVPDVIERDIFLCGPPPMMAGVVKALHALGVSDQQIHYERFALHPEKLK